ncbi:alpha/beta hydrolase-fold protein [Mucilaginibacter pedocola]|uniref:PA14 domain-containing protein n=1 Tax=Mucilaginibacter pedocola TaxID=1792845 RepID=A0A1S9PE79_9SPHI|nr:alpha/beta hydrolase-fold protein [Mucilaginibacter pedocola]OOQ59263.1 hypothetical protein BC343_28495 [Mucilaginibacter pedocola]
MKRPFTRLFLLITLIACTNIAAKAQDTVIIKQDIQYLDSLQSPILGQKRMLQVFLPEGYKPGSTDKYDVLYVLDGGNWNTGLIKNIQRFVEGESYMPPTIIVSVLGIDRNHDLTPTHISEFKTSGGADNFLNFITTELIPYINKKYPTNGDNTLWGHSFGGLFVINALLTQPSAFKSYIAADPSLWWENQYIKKIAPEKLKAIQTTGITLFISSREGTEGDGMKITPIDTVLQQYAPANLKWKSIKYPNETHASVRFKTTYDGLKFSYGWETGKIEFHPMAGVIDKKQPLTVWYMGDTASTHYTLNGEIPTLASLKATPDIVLDKAATLSFKQFTNRSRYDKTKTGTFTLEDTWKPAAKPKNARAGGLHYAYYEGDYKTATELKNLKPQQQGLADTTFDADKLPRKNHYAMVLDGFIEAKEDGYYILGLEADKNSKLYINNRMLVDWQGSYNESSSSYVVPLKKGFYPIRIEYFHQIEDFKLQLSYITPSGLKTKNGMTVPFGVLYSVGGLQ